MKNYTIQYPPEPMSPACYVTASDDELRMLGELCAIQGQIEWVMQLTVAILRRVTLPSARKLLSSPNFTANANVWLTHIEKRQPREDIKGIARAVVREIRDIGQGRNDFIHAVFVTDNGDGLFVLQRDKGKDGQQRSDKPAVALHNLTAKPMSNLKETRDKAAVISHYVWWVWDATNGMPHG